MTDKDWLLLLTLYEEGTITRAAQKLYISQPALTYRVKQIEKEFNTKIILRGSKGVIFTNEGEFLVAYASKMMANLESTKDHIINMKKEVQGTLRIGVSSNFALYQLPDLLEGFLERYPKVEISLRTGWSSEVLHLLQSEKVHLAIVRGEHVWKNKSLLLSEEPLCVASKDKIEIQDLPSLNQINYQTDLSLKSTFDQWWQNNFQLPPKISMEVDRIETCKELVKRGLGYGIFPYISLQNEERLYKINLSEQHHLLKRSTSALFREELLELGVLEAFVQYLQDYKEQSNNFSPMS